MEKLGERELDIMQALWKLGKATVGEVQEILRGQDKDIAYTTIQTMLNRLETKKIVTRNSSERTHYYRAVLKEPNVADSAIKRLTERFFRGSAEELVSRLVKKDLDADQLERIQNLIDEHRREKESK